MRISTRKARKLRAYVTRKPKGELEALTEQLAQLKAEYRKARGPILERIWELHEKRDE